MREIICKANRKDIDKVTDKWIEGYYYKSWYCIGEEIREERKNNKDKEM